MLCDCYIRVSVKRFCSFMLAYIFVFFFPSLTITVFVYETFLILFYRKPTVCNVCTFLCTCKSECIKPLFFFLHMCLIVVTALFTSVFLKFGPHFNAEKFTYALQVICILFVMHMLPFMCNKWYGDNI